jgi:hypothetical protein
MKFLNTLEHTGYGEYLVAGQVWLGYDELDKDYLFLVDKTNNGIAALYRVWLNDCNRPAWFYEMQCTTDFKFICGGTASTVEDVCEAALKLIPEHCAVLYCGEEYMFSELPMGDVWEASFDGDTLSIYAQHIDNDDPGTPDYWEWSCDYDTTDAPFCGSDVGGPVPTMFDAAIAAVESAMKRRQISCD